MDYLLGSKEFEGSNRELGIVLFHAYTGSPNDVNLLARKINKAGYAVVCPLFIGHNTGDLEELLDVQVDQWQKQTEAVIKYMTEQYSKVLAFGLSMGGIFATWNLIQEYQGLVGGGVFNSPVVVASEPNIEPSFMKYASMIHQKSGQKETFEQKAEDYLQKHRQQIDQLTSFSSELADQLAQITAPYYIAQSGKDELVDPRGGELLAKALIDSKQVDYHFFPHNTHVITVDKDRQAFEMSLLQFIDRFKEDNE